MLKNILLAGFFLITCASHGYSEVLLGWNTSGNLGTETTEASTTNFAGINSANLTLGSGVTAAGNGNRFGGSNWFNTGNANPSTLANAIAGNDFIQFIVSPTAGNQFTVTSFDFIWDRSGTGPSSVALFSSVDSFTNSLGSVANLTSGGSSLTTFRSISINGISNVSTSTTFRLYGFGATGTGGTGGFDHATNSATTNNVILNGSISAVPEPTSMVLVGLIGVAGVVVRTRRRLAKMA